MHKRSDADLHAEIAAFAAEHGGSKLDLDEDLEKAGIEALLKVWKVDLPRRVRSLPFRADSRS